MFSHLKDLSGHDDAVNCLEFSPDGSHLASGDDHGLLMVFNTPSGTNPREFQFEDSVTALSWCGTHSLFVGLANCELHFISLVDQKTYSLDLAPDGYGDLPRQWRDIVQIECITYNAKQNLVAVGVGTAVVVMPNTATHVQACAIAPLYGSEIPDARTARSTKAPKALPSEVRSLQFIEEGKALLVSFFEQGIHCYDVETQKERWSIPSRSYRIGRSAIDEQATVMVCSNLNDGFDLYDLKKRCWVRTVHREAMDDGRAVALPVAFVDDEPSRSILAGSSRGNVVVSSLAAQPQVQKLDHGSDSIEAVAAFTQANTGIYLATACADRGKGTYVRLWVKANEILGKGPPRPPQRNRVMISKSTATESRGSQKGGPDEEAVIPPRVLRQTGHRRRRPRQQIQSSDEDPSDPQPVDSDEQPEEIDAGYKPQVKVPRRGAGAQRRGRFPLQKTNGTASWGGCALGIVVGILLAVLCALAIIGNTGGEYSVPAQRMPEAALRGINSNVSPILSSMIEKRKRRDFSVTEASETASIRAGLNDSE